MRNSILILIVLLMSTICYAGDYVCSDKDGNITAKIISCGKRCSENKACMKVTREQFNSINKYSVVKDGKLTEMTAQEKADLDADEALAIAQAKIEADKALTIEKLIAVLESKEVLTKTEVEEKELSVEISK